MRVNCRCMRAALWSFRSAVPKRVSVSWTDELGWLAGRLGDARDLDVFIAEGLTSARGHLPLPGRYNLIALAEQRRAAAYDAVRATLDSDRYGQFKQGFPPWFKAREWEHADLSEKQRKNLDTNIDKYARKLLYRRTPGFSIPGPDWTGTTRSRCTSFGSRARSCAIPPSSLSQSSPVSMPTSGILSSFRTCWAPSMMRQSCVACSKNCSLGSPTPSYSATHARWLPGARGRGARFWGASKSVGTPL